MATRYFGERIKRNEDPRLLTGQALFVDDVHLPNMAHAAFLRSPYAHARLGSVDTSRALEREGVIAVYTADDLGDYWRRGPLNVSPPPVERIPVQHATDLGYLKSIEYRLGRELERVSLAEFDYGGGPVATTGGRRRTRGGIGRKAGEELSPEELKRLLGQSDG